MPNLMFRNDGGERFEDVTTAGGFGHLQKGHGVAFADLDNDGDQDVFLEVGGAFPGDVFPSALFENPGHGNHWITLALVGTESNRGAIGARIKVTIEEPGGSRGDPPDGDHRRQLRRLAAAAGDRPGPGDADPPDRDRLAHERAAAGVRGRGRWTSSSRSARTAPNRGRSGSTGWSSAAARRCPRSTTGPRAPNTIDLASDGR